jgi:hypothetical protein
LVRVGRGPTAQTHRFESIQSPSQRFIVTHAEVDHLESKGDVLDSGQAGKQFVILKDDTYVSPQLSHPPLGQGMSRQPVNPDFTQGRAHLAIDEFEQSGLTRSTGPHQKHQLTGVEAKAHVSECHLPPVAAAYVDELDRCYQ